MERQSGYPERRLGGIVGKESTGTCISYSPRTGRLCPRHTLIDCTVVVLPLALRYADSRARECYRIPARHLGEHHPSTSFPPSPQGLRLFARCADCAIARLGLDVGHAPREGAHVAENPCPRPPRWVEGVRHGARQRLRVGIYHRYACMTSIHCIWLRSPARSCGGDPTKKPQAQPRSLRRRTRSPATLAPP